MTNLTKASIAITAGIVGAIACALSVFAVFPLQALTIFALLLVVALAVLIVAAIYSAVHAWLELNWPRGTSRD